MIYDHPEREIALPRATADNLLIEMESSSIDKAIIMGLPWNDSKMCWENNKYIAQVMQEHPDKLIGFGVLPKPDNNLEDIITRIHEELGLCGIKVIPSWHGYHLNDRIFVKAIEQILKLNMVLMPHTDHLFIKTEISDTAYALYDVARRYPELKILAPHLGGLLCLYNLYQPIKSVVKNIMFITSVPLTMQMVVYAVDAIGAQNIAFGTDFPFNPSHEQLSLKEKLLSLKISNEEIELIAGKNILKFLNII